MNSVRFLGNVLIISMLGWGIVAEEKVRSQEDFITECVRNERLLEAPPEIAFQRCEKKQLKNCIDALTKQKKVVTAVRQEGKDRFLIDLGSNEFDWWEGQTWAQKGCRANTTGPYRRDNKNFEWFRQGWCSQRELALDQYYTFEEARERCELGYGPENTDRPKTLTR